MAQQIKKVMTKISGDETREAQLLNAEELRLISGDESDGAGDFAASEIGAYAETRFAAQRGGDRVGLIKTNWNRPKSRQSGRIGKTG